MPISNLPTFTAKQLLTAAQLNQIVTALQTKFSGNIAGADLVWPLVTDGDIDFGGTNGLLNLPTLWNVVNAAEYASFSDAVSALPTSGGAIYIPAGTAVTTDGINVTNADVCIFGDGSRSRLLLTGAASSGYLLRHTGDGSYRFAMYNLSVDGQSTGSAQDGIQLRQPLSARIHGVTFRNFTGRALWITNSGSAGFYADNVQVSNCLFEGGTLAQLEANDVQQLQVNGCQFDNPTAEGIKINPATSSYYVKHVNIRDNIFTSCVNSIHIIGNGTALSNQWGFINVVGNTVESDTGDGITVGSSTAHVTKCRIEGNTVDAPGGNGIVVNSHYGSVQNNFVYQATTSGIDLDQSEYLTVQGNHCRTAGAYGIDLGASSYCVVSGNECSNCTTAGIGSASTPVVPMRFNNLGDQMGLSYGGISGDVAYSGGTGSSAPSWAVIPGKTVNQTYDSVLITFQVMCSTNSGTVECQLDDGGGATNLGTVTLATGDIGVVTWLVGYDAGGTSSYVTSPNANGDRVSAATIDWTSDVSIKFSITSASGTVTIENMQVQVISGYDRGTLFS